MQTAIYLPSSPIPATPRRLSYTSPAYAHTPLRSSPLASPGSSPAAQAQARRRSQYKANAFSSPVAQRTSHHYAQRKSSGGGFVQGSSTEATASTQEAPRKAFLRERLKARCLERAQKKRERAVARGRRHLSSEPSSDGMDEMMDEDDDEDEDTMLNDELFCRIVASAKRKERHGYKLSYAFDVGSSFDPDMEDPTAWEEELSAPNPISTEPEDVLDEELEAYAAEAELNLDDLPLDDIFSYSDFEDGGPSTLDDDIEMD